VSGRLILISSYPKSGNTWTRAVLQQLRMGPDWKFSINEMPSGFYGFPRRLLFDALSPVNAGDLFVREIENMFPQVLRQLVREDPQTHIMKVHDDARRTRDGDWVYPGDAIYSVIYLVRHPFDVAVSCAHHLGISLPDSVGLMADGEIVSHFEDSLPLALPQHVGSWTGNIASWLEQTPYAVTLARYEDLHVDPVSEFGRLARAAGMAATLDDVTRAVAGTQFERMRQEEETGGFRERPRTSPAFFRAGKPRTWEEKLDKALIDRIVRDHGPMMARLGYAPDGGILPMPPGNVLS
jgi:aryl sulfotransferase